MGGAWSNTVRKGSVSGALARSRVSKLPGRIIKRNVLLVNVTKEGVLNIRAPLRSKTKEKGRETEKGKSTGCRGQGAYH